MSQRFLVIGSNSFSGAQFVEFLLRREYEVFGVSRLRFDSEREAAMTHFLHTTASEDEVSDRGYALLRRGRVQDAIEVFRLDVQRFPDSMYANESLGEALALSGDIPGAIKSYEWALELTTETSEHDRILAALESLRD